jgi:hypothetical protein
MLTRRQTANGLEAALTAIIQNQAQFVQNQTQFVHDMAEINRRYNELRTETAERLIRIESLLIEHDRLLKNMPETIRDKIGFKGD